MHHLAGHGAGHVAHEIKRRARDLLGGDVALERGALAAVMEHLLEAGNPGRRQRLDRARRDGVDPDALGPQVVSQIAHARLQRRLGHAHHVVVRDHLFRSHIGHGQDRTLASLHQRGRVARQNHQRIGAHVQGKVEALAAGLDKGIGEILFGRKRNGMDQDIQPAPFIAQRVENPVDLLVLGHVAGENDLGPDSFGQGAHAPLQHLARVGEGELRALPVQRLGDRPGDAPLVRHPEDHSPLPFQDTHKPPAKRQNLKVKR